MFEKFRLKKLSKVIQSVILNLFGQFGKNGCFDTFSKINFLNIENVALLYKKNKNIILGKSDEFLKLLDKYISNSGIDLSFLENVDLKKLIENFERLCSNGYINFIENDIERIKYIKSKLEKAYIKKDEKNVNILILAIFVFNLYSEDFIDILCKLTKEEWHERHEDIAIYFMEMELPSTVECLYKLAISDFEKYRDDEYCQLVEKCCYALGAIGTEDAKEKLKLLAKSDKDIIREHVEDTFEMYKLS